MGEQFIEIVTGDQSILKTIQAIIDNRVVGKIEIPEMNGSAFVFLRLSSGEL